MLTASNYVSEQGLVTASELIDGAEVCRVLGISRSSLWRLVRDGVFPRPIALSAQTRRWRREDLAKYIDARVAERDGKQEDASE
ncbi:MULTISPECIES: helix-turn-helix domain-containing protein [unclassified Chelatococcus]|uniref:helix-turn-helix transcriptional regulator n=1 Tax=unclassified Chelatococcus TaxID=2638111 RepID=UPI001BCAE6EC|nr:MULTISPECIES: helix-turn-helix domain-containing protein [unclassified Chelatococcus]MBS7698689.1 AlpA family phage regulatory protein [Chelatococcus sp. YT9]MBX3554729.1 AlpA family phage regulatory protein [Chelatococcus sp.]